MPGIEQKQAAFRFGVFELNARARELRKHGVKLKLQEQPLQILILLLEHPGEILTREEIQNRLWPENTYVDFDNAINSAIRKLRDALGDSPENPRFIETLARRGYRFIAPVSRPAANDAVTDAPPIPDARTVAVTVGDPKPPARKRHLWWIGGGLLCALFATGIGVRWWIAKSDETGVDMPLPAVPLTGNTGFETFPTISPEGTRVAYAWEERGKQVPNIYVKLVGQGDPIRLTTNPRADFAPAWSPDGQRIAFLRARAPSHAAVTMVSSLGGQEREIADISIGTDRLLHRGKSYEVPPPFLAWSPDGQWLLALEQKAPHEAFSIVRVSVETGEKRTLTFPPKHTNGDGGLAVAPDGKTLAFTRSLGLFERDIYLVSLSQDLLPRGEPKRLTFENKQIDGLAWTANGQTLVFSSERGGRLELWQMPARPDREPTRLTASGEDPGEVAISSQHRRLVYSHEHSLRSIWRLPLRGKRREPARALISSNRIEIQPRYSPDGQRIAFESNRSGHDEIWTCQADGSHPVQITTFKAWAGSPRWSPDAQKLAFDSNAAGNWDIYVVGSHGGKPTRLTTSQANQFRPSWSHDGKWIYYLSSRTGRPEVWKIPARGGAEVQVTQHGGAVPFESLDGEDLYYTKEQGLWKKPVRGGDESRVWASLLDNSFALAKRGVYFLQASPSSETTTHLQFLDFATHTVQTIAVVPGPLAGEISVSPDERWMLFGENDREGSELMLIENFH